MYTIEEIKVMLFDIVLNEDLDEIANLAHRLSKKPVLILDRNSSVLALAPNYPIGNDMFDKILQEGKIPYAYYDNFVKDAIFDYVDQFRGVSYLNWGVHKETPHLYAQINKNDTSIAGITFICEKDFKPEPYDMQMIELFAKAIGVLLSNKTSYNHHHNAFLLSQLFTEDVKISNKDDCLRDFKINPTKKFQLAVSRYKSNKSCSDYKLPFMCRYIEDHISNLITTFSENEIIILFYNLDDSKNKKEGTVKKLLDYLMSCGFETGISQIFTEIKDANKHKNQAYMALNIGKTLDPENQLYYFSNYANYYVAKTICDSPNSDIYWNSGFTTLEEQDKATNSMYLETLITFLLNSKEISKTAKQLHIHKSTLNYRLQKIQDMCELDLDNPNICMQLLLNKCMRDLL